MLSFWISHPPQMKTHTAICEFEISPCCVANSSPFHIRCRAIAGHNWINMLILTLRLLLNGFALSICPCYADSNVCRANSWCRQSSMTSVSSFVIWPSITTLVTALGDSISSATIWLINMIPALSHLVHHPSPWWKSSKVNAILNTNVFTLIILMPFCLANRAYY